MGSRGKKKGANHHHHNHNQRQQSHQTDRSKSEADVDDEANTNASSTIEATPRGLIRRASSCEYCAGHSTTTDQARRGGIKAVSECFCQDENGHGDGDGSDGEQGSASAAAPPRSKVDRDRPSAASFFMRAPQLTAFYCQCAAVQGRLDRIAAVPQDSFSATFVNKLHAEVMALFPAFTRAGILRRGNECSQGQATCPFVMLLSIFLPVLRALQRWIECSKPKWWLAVTPMPKTVATPPPTSMPPDPPAPLLPTVLHPTVALLSTQLELHHLLMQVTSAGARISTLIEDNLEQDQDLTMLLARLVPTERARSPHTRDHGKQHDDNDHCHGNSHDNGTDTEAGKQDLHSFLSPLSGSSSSSTRQHTARAATMFPVHDESVWPVPTSCSQRLPQIKKIALEFDHVLEQLKFELAELTEAVLDNSEWLVPHTPLLTPSLSQPPRKISVKDSFNAKMPVNEFTDILVHYLLSPLSQRVVAAPSPSRVYLFPKLLERCIDAMINEYTVGEVTKVTAIAGLQLERAILQLRSWAMQVESEYNNHLSSSNSRATSSTGDQQAKIPGLHLLWLASFKRLDAMHAAWIKPGKEVDTLTARSGFKSNVEHLRSTLVRSMTARSGQVMTTMDPSG